MLQPVSLIDYDIGSLRSVECEVQYLGREKAVVEAPHGCTNPHPSWAGRCIIVGSHLCQPDEVFSTVDTREAPGCAGEVIGGDNRTPRCYVLLMDLPRHRPTIATRLVHRSP